MRAAKDMSQLRGRLEELLHLRSALALASWDQEVNMPPSAADSRAAMIAYLSGEYHAKLLALDADGLIGSLREAGRKKRLAPKDAAIVREVGRDYELAARLPSSFVTEFAALTSRAQHVWAEARSTNDFDLFRPFLEKIVRLSREKAKLLGGANAYDALLDTFEPGMTAAELSRVFDELKAGLVPFLARIRESGAPAARGPQGPFPLSDQKAFLAFINDRMGFDALAGRLDASTHPFTSGFHPRDVRITTRYRENDLWDAVGSDIHELGHGLYEQGLPAREAATPLGEAASLSVHESQSRFWENMIGRNRHTWEYLFPELKKRFPAGFRGYSAKEWFRYLHRVRPSLIRTEADEVTYNLHIVLRFEMEKALIEGSLRVADLPAAWNRAMREYLGVNVPDDARGVLQDVHWSGGMIGYFPTYTLGNLYSAQLYEAVRRDMPQFDRMLARGEFLPVRDWLREKIHRHGRRYSAAELMRRATGKKLAVAPFLAYLEETYAPIYRI